MSKLEQRVGDTLTELQTVARDRVTLWSFIKPLKYKSSITRYHYRHSLRVALLARQIALYTHLDDKAVFYAGLTHDSGKCQTALTTLGKTEDWTQADTKEVMHHAIDGYKLLRGRFDFTAEVVLWVHRFQRDGYPKRLPKPLHCYSNGTKLLIAECGRMVAIADVYDALHRVNAKWGDKRALSNDEIRAKMIMYNPDRMKLIVDLYKDGILL